MTPAANPFAVAVDALREQLPRLEAGVERHHSCNCAAHYPPDAGPCLDCLTGIDPAERCQSRQQAEAQP